MSTEKLVIANLMELKLITIPTQSIFVGHRYLQYAETAWIDTPSIRYHMYMIPQRHALIDSISSAYCWSF